jgi:hypothetical protein
MILSLSRVQVRSFLLFLFLILSLPLFSQDINPPVEKLAGQLDSLLLLLTGQKVRGSNFKTKK